MKTLTFTLFALLAIFAACGEDNPTNNNGYTVTDELFYEKDYDSVYGRGIIHVNNIYMPMRMKKVKFTFEFITNSPAYSYIRINAGYYPHYWWDTIHTPGLYTIEHEFPIVQDSTYSEPYTFGNDTCRTCYAVVKNLKVYRSY